MGPIKLHLVIAEPFGQPHIGLGPTGLGGGRPSCSPASLP